MSEIVKASQFKLMEAADNAQIVAEINGEMLKAMVYRHKGKDRLSYAGAKFAAIQLGNIHVRESTVTYNKDLDQFEASALAFNGNNNLTLPGYAEQPRLMKIWDNRDKDESHLELDEFARRKAASKAVRNALMAVMPADHIAAYMKAMIDQGKSQRIKINKPKPIDVAFREVPMDDGERELANENMKDTQTETHSDSSPSQPTEITVESVHYQLSEFIPGLDDILKITDRNFFIRIGKTRILDDQELPLVTERIEDLGGNWSSEDNCWKIFKD